MESYRVMAPHDIQQLPKGSRQASHAMLYTKLNEKLFGKYDMGYAILMQLRFDGTLGFTGGIADGNETPEQACTRECNEELGVTPSELTITKEDHIITHYSDHTKFCLHFYAKEVSKQLFIEFEKKALLSHDWGQEVLGLIRCPLYTLPNGLGFPAFLKHQFIGNSRNQLITGIQQRGLLSDTELEEALKRSGTVDTVVTVKSAFY